MKGGILVAGVGNVLFGDDGFGVEVARRLASRPLPPGASVEDFGIRGLHLAYQLLDGYDALILIDTLARNEAPGTLTVIEPNSSDAVPGSPIDGHGLDPATVLRMVQSLGGTVGRTIVVGCEPADFEERIGLSPRVAGAVDGAVDLVLRLIRDLEQPKETRS